MHPFFPCVAASVLTNRVIYGRNVPRWLPLGRCSRNTECQGMKVEEGGAANVFRELGGGHLRIQILYSQDLSKSHVFLINYKKCFAHYSVFDISEQKSFQEM